MTAAVLDDVADSEEPSNWTIAVLLQDNQPLTADQWAMIAENDTWPSIRDDAAAREDCPPAVLATLVRSNDAARTKAICNPSCPPDAVVWALREGAGPLASLAVVHPNCPPDVIREALNAGSFQRADDGWDPTLFARAAGCQHLPEDIHVRLTGHPNTSMGYATAPWATANVLRSAANSAESSPSLHAKIAAHPNADSELLEQLSRERSPRVKTAVAQNPRTPSDVLVRLSKLKNGETRPAVAANPSTPPELLETMWQGSGRHLQKIIEDNPSCPPQIKVAGAFTAT